MINFAILGLGGIGAYHLAAVERQERIGRGRLVGVAEPSRDRSPAMLEKLEARGVRWSADYHALLGEEAEAQVLVIATPIQLHFEMAKACIERGLYVNLEKPPVPLVRQLDALIAEDAAERVSVGFQMISSPCMQAMKALILEGRLGTVRQIRAGGCWPRLESYYNRARWAGKLTLDGKPVLDGPATNALAHVVHNVMFLAGEGICEFAAPTEVQGEMYRARRIESYDTACMRGRFASGIEFSIAVTHAVQQPMPYRIEIQGSKGSARITDDGAVLETSRGVEVDQPEGTQELIDRDYDRMLDVIEGRQERFGTTLRDAAGYVSATNGMLASSGGIHDIDQACIRSFQADGSEGLDVAELREAVLETVRSGRLFSEQRLPWATARPTTVSMRGGGVEERVAAIIMGSAQVDERPIGRRRVAV